MNKASNLDYKRKYDLARHHAWAGSVLLAVLLAIRIFFETLNNQINNTIFLIIGSIIVLYILIALFYTYKYRTGLNIAQQIQTIKINNDLNNKELKLEKKKIKADVKKNKKTK